MALMKSFAPLMVLIWVALSACSSPDNKTAATMPGAGTPAAPAPPPPPPPFEYPAPVKGHYKEINTGNFDLVDGLAYSAAGGKGTVVFVTSKPIASPILNGSTCPMTEARAISLIRDANWAEVTIDAAGRSKFYGAGTQYTGTSRSTDVGSHEWSIKGGKPADAKVAGSVNYRGRGTFEFTLPVFTPKNPEVSESDVMDGRRYAADRRKPTEAELTKAYTEMRKAALAKDLKAMLELQGFDAKQVQAIRGLAGIDGELAAHADRFLDPGTPEEPTLEPGYGAIGARGKTSKGAAFANYYFFAPCGDRLLLTSIGLNPQ
jgi:hypothetical protein